MPMNKGGSEQILTIENVGKPSLRSVSHISEEAHKNRPRTAHSHGNELEIFYVQTGTGEIILDGKAYTIRAGDIVGVNSGVVHDDGKSYELRTLVFSISDVEIPYMEKNHIVPPAHSPIIRSSDDTRFVSELLECIESDVRLKGFRQSSIIMSLLRILIYKVALMFQETDMENDAADRKSMYAYIEVLKIRNYIDEHYSEDLSLEDLAREATLSPTYASRIFKKYMGVSPIQYLKRRRIGEAESLLISTDESITNIAIKCGYGSANNFNRVFLKLLGISPSVYRKNHRRIQVQIR